MWVTVAPQACVAGVGALGASLAAMLHYFAAAQCMLNEPWPSHAQVSNESRFDFIVVGAGSAGSALAARLATLRQASVLLVEAGGDPPQESIVPGFKNAMYNSIYDWNFTSIAEYRSGQALEGGRQPLPRGRMLGGTGSLNDMIYARGFPEDYERWAAGPGWDWETVLKYFKKTEHLTDEKILHNKNFMQYHGTNGEILVASPSEPEQYVDVFLKAFNQMGFPIVSDMTNPSQLGAGRFLHTVRGGRRESSATELLNKVAENGNIFVLKNALVTKVLTNATKAAYGIQVLLDGESHNYYADKEVIISAGTFNTPKLLMLSGIGPKDHLAELDIDLVQDLPVGENLHDHVMALHYIAADSNICTKRKGAKEMDLTNYLYNRLGPLAYTDSMGLYVNLNSSDNQTIPDFAIYPTCIPRNSGFKNGCRKVLNFKEYICDQIVEANEHHELMSFAVVRLSPESRGRIRLVSKDPLDNLDIKVGAFSNLNDLNGYPEVMEIVNAMANTSFFQRKGAFVLNLQIHDCEGLSGRLGLRCQARAMGLPAWHAVGTAAMGSVLDSRLKVIGVKGLRVVDASVMPAVVRGNTNAPTIMIAERAFDFIKEDHYPALQNNGSS